MSMKKLSGGFYTTVLSAILALVGMIFYFINCGTAYFANLGVDPVIAGCGIAAIVVQVLLVVLARNGQKQWMDILPVAASVLLAVSVMLLVASRINGIAGIMTFENNAQTQADLSSAIVSIVTGLLAMLVSIVSAFMDVTREGK